MTRKDEMRFRKAVAQLTLTEYTIFVQQTSRPAPVCDDLLYFSNALGGEVGELQNRIKKVYRDKAGAVSKEDAYQIVLELGDALWYISKIALVLGFTLAGVAAANIHKLVGKRSL